MARRLRLQSDGAIYHALNRGNYRRDLFDTPATAEAFLSALGEACERYRWRIHAYAVMRNHFHLALQTPQANLAAGMHWLQGTFATRFNRFRSERGHLFQGRYHALLVEDTAALARVVNYIHLNPVRAAVVAPAQVADFRWGSLARFTRAARPGWLSASPWIEELGCTDSTPGWRDYTAMLTDLAADPEAQAKAGLTGLSVGWAIGPAGWKNAVAKDLARLSLVPEPATSEAPEIAAARWADALRTMLDQASRTRAELARDAKGSPWKVALAARLRREVGASPAWLAENLSMGTPNSVRSHLSRASRAENQ